MKICSLKLIAHCESTGCPLPEPVNQAIDSTTRMSASASAFQDLDIAMEGITEQYDASGVYYRNLLLCLYLIN
jgi:hypothetical protein